MAGRMPWYQIDSGFSGHKKTLHLCAITGDDNAGMYVVRLFEHCSEHALDGQIPAVVVEGAAGWRKKRGALLAALEKAGFLELLENGELRVLHDWEERNGARIRKWQADTAKPRGNKAPSPARPSSVPRGTAAGPPRDQRGTSAGFSGEDTRFKKEETIGTERSIGTETATGSEPPPVVALAGGGPALDRVRERLAKALGVPRIGIGNDERRVIASFQRWLRTVGEDALVKECVRLAREKRTTPGHLSWWPGFLDTVPDRELEAAGGGA